MRPLLITLALPLLAALSACASTNSASQKSSAPATASASAVKAPGDARIGDKTRCPVTGEEFVVRDDSPKVEYEGKTYYFCCADCPSEFKADPRKYVGTPAT